MAKKGGGGADIWDRSGEKAEIGRQSQGRLEIEATEKMPEETTEEIWCGFLALHS